MAEQLLKDANSAFVDEEYESALDLYTKSIEAEPSAEAHANRSHANFKLGHFQEAVSNQCVREVPVNGCDDGGRERSACTQLVDE